MKTSKKLMALALAGTMAASSLSMEESHNWRMLLSGYRKSCRCYKGISGISV
jgi:hypothetical protein